MEEGQSESAPLSLTHRHAIDSSLGESTEIESLQRRRDRLPPARTGKQGQTRCKFQVLADRQSSVETSVARGENAKLPIKMAAIMFRTQTAQLDVAPIRQDQPRCDPKQRRLSRS